MCLGMLCFLFLFFLFCSIEKHHTISDTEFSVALKETLCQFFNTAIIPILVYLKEDEWFLKDNLMSAAMFNMLSISFVKPVMLYIQIPHLFLMLKRRRLESQALNCTTTQAEASAVFEPPDFDITLAYSHLAILILVPAFFFPIFPLGIIFTLGGIFSMYWIYKVI
jgi:hypothetical protein